MNSDIILNNFSGNAFDRFNGLDFLFHRCNDKSVLDIGNSNGLVTYEFARHGASVCHGLDLDKDRVTFCKNLFNGVPVDSNFIQLDLVSDYKKLLTDIFYKTYDIVLFLSVWQKIERINSDILPDLMKYISSKAKTFLAIRTNSEQGLKYIPKEFKLVESCGWYKQVGPINIFQRNI